MTALPMVCPAATPIHLAADEHPSVLCGVVAISNEHAEVGGSRERGHVSPLMSGRRDPRVVLGLCAGDGVPGSARSYCACAFWRAQRDAEHAGRHGDGALRDEQAARPPSIDPELAEAVRLASNVHGMEG